MKNKTSLAWLQGHHKRYYKNTLMDLKALVESELNGVDDEDFTATGAFDIVLSKVIKEGASLNALIQVESIE